MVCPKEHWMQSPTFIICCLLTFQSLISHCPLETTFNFTGTFTRHQIRQCDSKHLINSKVFKNTRTHSLHFGCKLTPRITHIPIIQSRIHSVLHTLAASYSANTYYQALCATDWSVCRIGNRLREKENNISKLTLLGGKEPGPSSIPSPEQFVFNCSTSSVPEHSPN